MELIDFRPIELQLPSEQLKSKTRCAVYLGIGWWFSDSVIDPLIEKFGLEYI